MKKLSTTRPLEISKETIATLSEEELQAIEGGAAAGAEGSCIFATCHGTGLTDHGNAAEEATT